MSLIICPECGKEFSDKAAACPNCGYPINNEDSSEKNIKETIVKNTIQQNSAAKELKKLKRQGVALYVLLGIIFGILGITALIDSIWSGGLFGLVLCIICFSIVTQRIKRMKELQKLVSGHNKILICPYCKSTNVSSSIVQTGVTTGPQKSRVSWNLNPLRPFTHTNVKTSASSSAINYGSKFQCNSCGKIFERAEEYWS